MEMIISLALFSVVATVALGALVKILTANRKAQSLQSALTNLNFTLESMARELRVGESFHCDSVINDQYGNTITPKGCYINDDTATSPNNRPLTSIAFKSYRKMTTGLGSPCNLATIYAFQGVTGDFKIKKAEQTNCLQPADATQMVDLLDGINVKVTNYRVAVGPTVGTTLQSYYPYVFIRLMGYAGALEKDRTYFDIQTTISSRIPQREP